LQADCWAVLALDDWELSRGDSPAQSVLDDCRAQRPLDDHSAAPARDDSAEPPVAAQHDLAEPLAAQDALQADSTDGWALPSSPDVPRLEQQVLPEALALPSGAPLLQGAKSALRFSPKAVPDARPALAAV